MTVHNARMSIARKGDFQFLIDQSNHVVTSVSIRNTYRMLETTGVESKGFS